MSDVNQTDGPATIIVSAANATGVPNTIKGKVQKAILRLVMGTVNPDTIEKLRSNASTIEGRSRIDAMVAEEIGRQAIADPIFMERAKARFLGDIAQKQENLESVARKAQQKIDSADDSDAPPLDPDAEPSQDWMNVFTRLAEDASSEELRERLAATLAGEARKPGTYSRSTIRLIAELERDVIITLQEILKFRVGNAILREESWSKGEMFAQGVLLEDNGLLSGSSGFTQRLMNSDSNGNAFLIGDQYGLVTQGMPNQEKHVSIWLLTRTGSEVASLLPPPDERVALRRFVKSMDKNNINIAIIGRVKKLGEQVQVMRDEVAWSKS